MYQVSVRISLKFTMQCDQPVPLCALNHPVSPCTPWWVERPAFALWIKYIRNDPSATPKGFRWSLSVDRYWSSVIRTVWNTPRVDACGVQSRKCLFVCLIEYITVGKPQIDNTTTGTGQSMASDKINNVLRLIGSQGCSFCLLACNCFAVSIDDFIRNVECTDHTPRPATKRLQKDSVIVVWYMKKGMPAPGMSDASVENW